MSEESAVVVCPNPKCQKEIEEPIILTILSVTPPKKYEACPHCFTKLESEPIIEQKDVSRSTVDHEEVMEEEVTSTPSANAVLEKVKDSGPRFLKRFRALIPGSNGPQKEEREITEEPQAEPSGEAEIVTKEEPKTKSSAEKEKVSSGCPHSFGYLAKRPPETPIPQECLICPKIVDCMLKIEE